MAKKTENVLSRREFWKVTGVGSLVGSQVLKGSAAEKSETEIVEDYGGPTPPVEEVVLFPFDDFSVPLRYRLQVGMVSATNAYKLNTQTVVETGKPGSPDSDGIAFYGSVKRFGDELRMWYIGSSGKGVWRVCYALSKDGINWEKPALGLVELNGNTQNNLVDFDRKDVAACLILHEPEDPDPNRRFKMVIEVSPFEIRAAFSPDGLHWKESPHNPILKHNSLEPGGLAKFNGCYYLNGQGGSVGGKRALVTYLSYDFDDWMDAVVLGLRRDVPPYRQAPGPHAGEQVHLGAALWNRGNVLLGVYGQWHGESNERRYVSIDLGLLVSNDAMHFREPIPEFQIVSAYEVYIPDDHESAVRAPGLEQGEAFENIGERTLFWYSPWSYQKSVCVATWVRDRLGYFQMITDDAARAEHLALNAPHSEAAEELLKIMPKLGAPHFISCPLDVSGLGMRVFINVDGISDQSHVTIEVLDKKCRPMPGYSGDDCIPITTPGLRQPVTWRNKQTLDKFGQPFRVKVSWGGNRPAEAYVYAVYVSTQEHA